MLQLFPLFLRHCRYKPNELKYFPLNTAIYGPPKRIVNPLVKVTSGESDDDVDDSQEVKTASVSIPPI